MNDYLLDTSICVFLFRDKFKHLGRVSGLKVENWIKR